MSVEKKKLVRKYSIDCGGVSKTIQSHAVGITPPEIAARYLQTGQLPQADRRAQYLDLTKMPKTGLEAQVLNVQVQRFWEGLSSQARGLYPTPADLLRAVDDPSQRDKLVELGILRKVVPVTVPTHQQPSSKSAAPTDKGSPIGDPKESGGSDDPAAVAPKTPKGGKS